MIGYATILHKAPPRIKSNAVLINDFPMVFLMIWFVCCECVCVCVWGGVLSYVRNSNLSHDRAWKWHCIALTWDICIKMSHAKVEMVVNVLENGLLPILTMSPDKQIAIRFETIQLSFINNSFCFVKCVGNIHKVHQWWDLWSIGFDMRFYQIWILSLSDLIWHRWRYWSYRLHRQHHFGVGWN